MLGADRPAYVAGRLLAARREGADADTVERTLQLHRATVRKHVAQLGVSVLEVPEEYSGAIQESLRRTGLFQYVERDFYAQIAGTPNDPLGRSFVQITFPPRTHALASSRADRWNSRVASGGASPAWIAKAR